MSFSSACNPRCCFVGKVADRTVNRPAYFTIEKILMLAGIILQLLYNLIYAETTRFLTWWIFFKGC
jgi:hypothetical protein